MPRGTPFLSAKKGGKEVPRGEPLGTPGGWPTFFSGKPAGGRIPEPAYIQERACGPGVWVAAIFHPRAQPDPGGPGPPCCMDFGSGKSVNAGFPEKKTGQFSGGPGGNPREPFCLLLGLGPKEGGRAFNAPFSGIPHVMRGHTEKPFFFPLMPRGTPFLSAKKGGKEASGGFAP